jgi:hypothetical protein
MAVVNLGSFMYVYVLTRIRYEYNDPVKAVPNVTLLMLRLYNNDTFV